MIVQCAVAASLGAFGALGQAPFNQPVALLFALAMGFLMHRRQKTVRRAALTGWAFGLGYFALALVWILEPFQVDPDRHGWMAPFALLFLSGGLALFWGAAFGAARWLLTRSWPLILTWTAAEMLRAYLFTGFPWASPAQVLVEGMASRSLAWSGPHGATLWLMSLAWVLSFPAIYHRRHVMRVGQALLLGGSVALLMVPPREPPAALTDHVVRLVQPNVPQDQKWDPDVFETFFQRLLDLSAAPAARAPDLVIWPETAIPWRLDYADPVLPAMARAAGGAPLIFGANRAHDGRMYNALAVLDASGAVAQTYDKHHAVPFGEYVPFGNLLGRLGISGMATRDGFGFSEGPGPQLLDLGPLGKATPLICYEAVFAHLVGAAPERPDMLIQITNDAWFGQAAGPQQHLAQARMRAIEQGLPLMRAANTGISAMIDPFGRVTNSLALGQAGAVDAPLPAPLEPTLYARTGDLPLALGLAAFLGGLTLRARRRRISD
jgi:apolipoprotein N-acyltransferase